MPTRPCSISDSGDADSLDQAEQALAIARDVDDPALLARTLTAYGFIASLGYHAEVARGCFAEAIGLARAVDDRWRLSQILAVQARGAHIAGDPIAVRAAGEEGRDLADAIGDGFNSRVCRFYLGGLQQIQRRFSRSRRTVRRGGRRGRGGSRRDLEGDRPLGQSMVLAGQGEAAAARAAAEAILEGGAELGGRYAVFGHLAVWIRGLGRRGFRGGARGARGRPPVPDCRERWRGGDCGASGMPRPRWQTGISLPPAVGPTRPRRQRPAGG